ncbi:major coat protein [Salmonella enterica]|uniref:major coat protein n=1 Tax=Salmonella enterica TaxID=28901 RepID=UPI001FD3E177|nr:major coat protein [Salmonella enterica]
MKILSTVKYKVALASTALFISASSFAAEGATGGTDYAGQAMDALLTQANDLIGKVWPVVVAVVALGLPFVFSKILFKSGLNFTQGHSLPLY